MVQVSFCIPTYNAENFIFKTICSIDTYGLESFEIIISDNMSSDGTVKEVMRALQYKKFTNVKVYSNPDRGISENWNFVLSKASGSFVRLIMQDDVIYKGSTALLISKLETYKSAVAIFSNRELLFEDTNMACNKHAFIYDLFKPLRDQAWFDDSGEGVITNKFFAHSVFTHYQYNKFGEPSFALLRRSALLKAGTFSSALKQSLDYEYWYRLLKFGDIVLYDEVLGGFRVHKSQMSQKNRISHTFEPVHLKYILLSQFTRNISFQNLVRLVGQMCQDCLLIMFAKLRSRLGKSFRD